MQLVAEESSNSTKNSGGCGFTGTETERSKGGSERQHSSEGKVENRIIGLGWMDDFTKRFKVP